MSYRILDDRDIVSLNKNFSNSLKGTLTGTIVRADDVSPNEHNLNVKLYNKNIVNLANFQLGKSYVGAGMGSDIYTQDSTVHASNMYIEVEPSTTYTFSLDNSVYWLDRISEMDENDLCTYNHAFYAETWLYDTGEYSFTTKSATKYIAVRVKNKDGATPTLADLQAINLQIEKGDSATEYIPYADPSTVPLLCCGKNLIDISQFVLNQSVSSGGAGSPCNPTSTDGYATHWYIPLLPETEYTISLDNSVYWLDRICEMDNSDLCTWNHAQYSSGEDPSVYTFKTQSTTAYMIVRVKNKNGNTVTLSDLESINIQVEMGAEATDYEAFKGNTYTPNEDGSVDNVMSVSPTMIVSTSRYLTMEFEYSKDIGTILEKLTNAIINLGGTV